MIRENFFTGEPVIDGSPPFLENNIISENEAEQNASFGKYDYDPGFRMMSYSNPVNMNPGGYGYNTNPYFNNYMNPPLIGLGSNPYNGYNQYYQYQQPVVQEEVRYFLQPVNFAGSEYLPPMNYEEEIEKLKMEYWMREQEVSVKDSIDRSNYYNPYFGGLNYYGVPYFNNPYQYNSINSEINQKITELQDQARENRISLNLQLARLAHNISGDTYNDESLEERYNGKYISVPGSISNVDLYQYNRFNNMVPFDNSQYYREHYAAVSREYHSVISENSNMQECFENMGILNAKYELEEEQHRRRNGAMLYNSDDNSYKYFVRSKVAERYAAKNGTPMVNNPINMQQDMMNSFPTLSQSAKLCDDGTLNITCNFGSNMGKTYSVHNSQEAGYEQDRERFNSFIDSIPGSIYLNNPNPNMEGNKNG